MLNSDLARPTPTDEEVRAVLSPLRSIHPTAEQIAEARRQAGAARRPTGRGWVPRAGLAAVAIAAGVAGIAVGTGGSGTVLRPQRAEAAPLVKLTRSLVVAPAPAGDATLTIERTEVDDQTHTKLNLVTDRGSLVYFGTTRAELRSASASAATGKATGPGTVSGWIEGAAAAGSQTPAEAVETIHRASGIPIVGPGGGAPVRVDGKPSGDKPGGSADELTQAERDAQRDNAVWTTSLSVLQLAGGRPDVRAGALKAMSAVGARTARTTVDGRPALRVTMAVGTDGYQETLTIDAVTGVPIQFAGGSAGQAPDVSATYDVTRVDAKDLGH